MGKNLLSVSVNKDVKDLALKIATDDIKFNRIGYHQRTTLAEFKRILNCSVIISEKVLCYK